MVLPEMFNCPYSNESFPKYAEDIEGGKSESAAAMAEAAKQNNIILVAGSMPEISSGKLYNSCLIFDEKGKLLGKHRKVNFSSDAMLACWLNFVAVLGMSLLNDVCYK